MPPPDSPREVADHGWAAACTKLGVPDLPIYYKEFVSIYGTGSIGDFLWVMNPFSQNPSLNAEMAIYFRKSYDTMKKDFPKEFPRESGSFLPWAMTDNGDVVVWLLTDENPNLWPVGIQGRQVWEEELTSMTTPEFLETLLKNKLETNVFPHGFLNGEMNFKPV